jgi:hypothetical protein
MRSGASCITRRASAVALVLLVAVGTAACARVSASRSAPQADPPTWVKDAALAQASAAGDASPTMIEWALTNAARAAPVVGTTGGDPAEEEYLVIMTGQFVDKYAHVPPGQPAPSGTVLVITFDAATHIVNDYGIGRVFPTHLPLDR